MPPNNINPALKGLFAGAFGKYYRDAELTIYAGKMVKGKWVPASAQPDTPAQGTQAQGTQNTTAATPADAIKKRLAAVKQISQQKHSEDRLPSSIRARIDNHVQINTENRRRKVDNIATDAMDGTKFTLGADGIEDLMDFGEDLQLEDYYPDSIPFRLVYAIQKQFGRPLAGKRGIEKDRPTPVIWQSNTNPDKPWLVMKDKEGNYIPSYATYIPNEDAIVINSDWTDQNSFDIDASEPISDETVDAIETLVHETLHSCSPRFYKTGGTNEELQRADLKAYWSSPIATKVEEGMTEYLARHITSDLLNSKSQDVQYDAYRHTNGSYQNEVEAIDELATRGGLDLIDVYQTVKTHKEMMVHAIKAQRRYLAIIMTEIGLHETDIQRYINVADAEIIRPNPKKRKLIVFDRQIRMLLRRALTLKKYADDPDYLEQFEEAALEIHEMFDAIEDKQALRKSKSTN